MSTRHGTALQPSEGNDVPPVPGCDAGPAGRIGFVLRELGHLLARWRDRRRAAANQGPGPAVRGLAGHRQAPRA
ncbi:hypothetical protein NG819_15565 [Pseudarthrobacter sp. Fe7]|nr:hypothetical protein NG819_15565 [Pseudarthrobacter sp. Fe7]